MNIGLLVMDGAHTGERIAVPGMLMLVGRGPQCHVRPTSPQVSERHCSLLQREDGFYLRDLESKSGTFLNDRRLRGGEIEVRDGDLVRVGPLTFIVQTGADQDALGVQAAEEPALASAQELPTPEPAAAAEAAIASRPHRARVTMNGTVRPAPT
jgi:pSer/pThr/pTyr-binding forkhead associated (FHA) protein